MGKFHLPECHENKSHMKKNNNKDLGDCKLCA